MEAIIVTGSRRSRLDASGFYDRLQHGGFGYLMTRADIEQRNPHRVADLFYSIPGAQVVQPARFGQSHQIRLRGGCTPRLVLDGIAVSMPGAVDDVLNVNDLEALEVYPGIAGPIQYLGGTCGTIMAWTREGVGGSPLTWKRVLAAAGFVGLAVLLAR
jgi:hypothetical protein